MGVAFPLPTAQTISTTNNSAYLTQLLPPCLSRQVELSSPVTTISAPLPESPSSIPLPPGSPLSSFHRFPHHVSGGGRLRGGAPLPGYQPEGFTVHEWRPGNSGGSSESGGTSDRDRQALTEEIVWPSLQEVADRAWASNMSGSASQMTLQDAIRFSGDGAWWSAPPPPPPPPTPPPPPEEERKASSEVPGRSGWSPHVREATEDVLQPGEPEIDWWEGGPKTTAASSHKDADVTLGDVERSKSASAQVS